MLRHIVLLRWKTDVTEDERGATLTDLRALVRALPGVQAVVVEADCGIGTATFDAALVADFVDEAAWRSYQADPGHKSFVADRLGPKLAERAAIQVPIRTDGP